MKKKLLAVLITCMLVLAMLPLTALAETGGGNEARIGDVEYATLDEAFAEAGLDDVIYLLKDVTRTEKAPIVIANKITLDFNGHSLIVDKDMFKIDGRGVLILNKAEINQTSEDDAYGFITDCSGMVELQSTAGDGIRLKTSFIRNLKEGSGLKIETATILSDKYVVMNTEKNTGITIMDGVYTGKSGVEGEPSLQGAVFYDVRGELQLNGGTYTGGWYCIDTTEGADCLISGNCSFTSNTDVIRIREGASLKINNCNVNMTGVGFCINANGGTVSIDAGEYKADKGGGFYVSSGGEITVEATQDVLVETKAPAVKIDGSESVVEIKGGTYVSTGVSEQDAGCIEQNNGKFTVTGGSFTGRDAGLYVGNAGNAVADIKGGTFIAQAEQGAGLYMAGGKVNIESGTFEGKGKNSQAFFMDGGKATVSGGNFIAENGYGIWNSGINATGASLTINDCTVNTNDTALYFSGTTGNVVNGGTYTSETTNALRFSQSAAAVISNGLFTNSAGGAAIKDDENGLTVAEGSAADPANWKETSASVVRISFPVASINDTEYASLEDAFAASKDGDTIKLLVDLVNYDRPAIEVNKKVTLDFNKHNITVNENMFQINEKASLTLKNADVKQLKTSRAHDVDYAFIKDCKGELIIASTAGKNINLGKALINTLYSTGSFTMNGGTVNSLHRVIKDAEAGSKITINDGTITADNGEKGDKRLGEIISSCKGDFEMNGGKLSSVMAIVRVYEPGSVLLKGGVIEAAVDGILAEGDCKVEVNDTTKISGDFSCITVDGSELVINGGTFTATQGDAITVQNTENAQINDGTFQASKRCVVIGDSTATLKGGKYSLTKPAADSECECVLLVNSYVEIKDGEYKAEKVSTIVIRDSDVVMDGGTIYSETNGIEIIGGQLTVNDGTIDTTEGDQCIFIARYEEYERELTDTVTINGGTFKAGEGKHCVWSKYGHIFVNDGTFQAGDECIFNETGENEINGGTFTSQKTAAVRMDKDAVLTLTGGKFTNASGAIALPDKDNVVIATGYMADPMDWKETKASVIEIIPNVYKVIEGANGEWKSGSEKGLQFRADGEYAKFVSVSVDGKELKKSDYKAWSGSTYVELQPDYLKTLSVGKHNLKVLYTDGQAETVFTIKGTNPVTADNSLTILWIVMALLSGATVIIAARKFVAKR